ncbi:MAG: DUF4407 domain-containing protein [Chitinophagaceae bacterium]
MQLENNQVSKGVDYAPNYFQKFLWWLSTADIQIIASCAIDKSRYAIIGMSVLGTWVFATLAWTYFFSTVVSQLVIAILLGIIMGCLILSIDRMLIKGMNQFNKRQIFPILLRIALATTIGTFMAQPALLYLFNKEIQVQISIDNEQKKHVKKQQQDTVYFQQKKELIANKNSIQKQLQQRYDEVAAARQNFISETDGSGGTKKIGLQAIAKAKQQEYEKLQKAYDVLLAQQNIALQQIDSTLLLIDKNIATEQRNFEQLLNDGFLTRIEALNHLLQKNTALQFRYYLLIIILLLIELMPVFAKLLLPTGTYDEKVLAIEAMEKDLLAENIQHETSLKKLYNQLAFERDVSSIQALFNQSKDVSNSKVSNTIQQWSNDEHPSFKHVWKEVQKDILSKYEN